jgi:hypothetical protein
MTGLPLVEYIRQVKNMGATSESKDRKNGLNLDSDGARSLAGNSRKQL